MTKRKDLDAYERPPVFLKSTYKSYQRISLSALDQDAKILDLSGASDHGLQKSVIDTGIISQSAIRAACHYLHDEGALEGALDSDSFCQDVQIYEAQDIPGLHFIPSLIPKATQVALLSKLLHRDLADERHKTNVHLHHRLPYEFAQQSESLCFEVGNKAPCVSFFNVSPASTQSIPPIAPLVHKPLTFSQFLNRKLRWVTLGGQYNWTQKCYPNENPLFPTDIAAFIHGLFPEMKPEAAIVNVYTPGDTLSLHRDVSEECENGLVSISIGCDAIFVIGMGSEEEGDAKSLAVRLRSGDAVYMEGQARFAWHGVPRIISETCPEWLRDWPAGGAKGIDHNSNSTYEAWRGWMSNKRINLNLRQMRD